MIILCVRSANLIDFISFAIHFVLTFHVKCLVAMRLQVENELSECVLLEMGEFWIESAFQLPTMNTINQIHFMADLLRAGPSKITIFRLSMSLVEGRTNPS